MCIQTRPKMDHSGKSQKWINATGIRIRALHEWKDNTGGGKLCTDHDLPETQLELLDVICYQLGEWPISYRLFDILPYITVREHTGWATREGVCSCQAQVVMSHAYVV